ncbi:MAG TPA: 30S ribosomal protein S16 [Patescibacteria group bacterium]|nr:30S ribosomal protein S16 [Patescibacteria group bacterium]
MSMVIRLSRTGKKGERKFRVVVKEKRSRRDGKAIENLGWYIKGVDNGLEVDRERIKYWISVGAKPSPVISKLLK